MTAHLGNSGERLLPLLLGILMPLGCSDIAWTWPGRYRSAPATAVDEPAPVRPVATAVPDSQRAFSYRYPDEPPVVDYQQLREFVGRFRHRLIVIDVWASWSQPSVRDLGTLAGWQEKYQDDLFQVISCNFDDAEGWSAGTVATLTEYEANFPCVVVPKSARDALRQWLHPGWTFELPARFLIDRRGEVVAAETGPRSLATIETALLQRLRGSRDLFAGALPAGAGGLRLRVIDTRTAEARSLPETIAAPAAADALARRAAESLKDHLDRSQVRRIAILPFASAANRARSSTFGRHTAEQLAFELRRLGFYDLIEPAAAEALLSELGTTALAVDFDPAVVQNRIAADFIVIGYLRGEVPTASKVAGSVSYDGD